MSKTTPRPKIFCPRNVWRESRTRLTSQYVTWRL